MRRPRPRAPRRARGGRRRGAGLSDPGELPRAGGPGAPRPSEPEQDRSDDQRAAALFHLALVFGFVPVVGLPFSWGAALLAALRRTTVVARRYAGLAMGVALADALVAVVAALAFAGLVELPRPPAPAAPKPWIGVELDPGEAGPGARVERVTRGSPAAAAGLEDGDRVVAVDGAPVDDADGLLAAVAASEEGRALELGLERAGAPLTVDVLPESSARTRGLFEVGPAPAQPEGPGAPGPLALLPAVLALALFVGLAARRAGGVRPVVVGLLAVQLLWVLASVLGSALPVMLLGGWSSAAALGGVLLSSAAGLAASLLVLRALRAARVLPAARGARTATTVLLGIGYLVALAPRSGYLALGLSELLRRAGLAAGPADALSLFGAGTMSPAAALLLTATVVLLAPLYEEVLFRGVLLPWLARGLGAPLAVLGSGLVFGLLHANYGGFTLVTVVYGLVLGWARVRSGGLLAPWLLHAAINLVASFPIWWPLVP